MGAPCDCAETSSPDVQYITGSRGCRIRDQPILAVRKDALATAGLIDRKSTEAGWDDFDRYRGGALRHADRDFME